MMAAREQPWQQCCSVRVEARQVSVALAESYHFDTGTNEGGTGPNGRVHGIASNWTRVREPFQASPDASQRTSAIESVSYTAEASLMHSLSFCDR